MNEANKLKTIKRNIKLSNKIRWLKEYQEQGGATSTQDIIDNYTFTHGAFNGFNSTYNQVTVTEKDASDFARYFACNPDAFNIMMDWLKDSKSKPKTKPKWWQWFGMV